MDYEWDEAKAVSNLAKHGIRFADVVGVFEDDLAISREDPDSESERRFVIVGLDFCGRVLSVVYTHRGEILRLMSARAAARRERRAYEQR